ncbi:hypothetical protein ACFLSQ_10215, partial [Bacteroidota bacterium]
MKQNFSSILGKYTDSKNPYTKFILYSLLLLFIYVFIVNAWVGDDAYITFRTVDNFINGYGLTWNTGERVQAYTHPLWMFIHSFFYFISGNIYYTTIFLSFGFSFAAIYLLMFKVADNKLSAIAGTVTLIISKLFIDYTSSGLENPLTYFLIIIFLIFYLKDDEAKAKIFKLSLITALAALNRMDTVLLFLPGLLYIVAKNRKAKNLLYVLYGFIPFIIWEIFSIIYYGFPLPNTYYAKLNTGIPLGEYISQGISYYANLFNNDPMSGVVIFGGIIVIIIYSIKRKTANIYLPLVVGIFMYLLYILRIGGDFMSGRFFTGPLLMVVAVLCNIKINYTTKKSHILLLAILVSLTILSILYSSKDGLSYSKLRQQNKSNDESIRNIMSEQNHGIQDERLFYYNDNGFLTLIKHGTSNPLMPEVKHGQETRSSKYKTITRIMIGIFGYYAGPDINIIDYVALSEPFLSKLKVGKNPIWEDKWRIGHFYRKIPLGYIKTIETGKNQIEDSRLKEYYEKLKIVTQADIFAAGRFTEIWKFNTGFYNELLVDNYKENDEPKLFSGGTNTVLIYYLRSANYFSKKKKYKKALFCYKELIKGHDWLKNRESRYFAMSKISQIYFLLNELDSAEYYIKLGMSYSMKKDELMEYVPNL